MEGAAAGAAVTAAPSMGGDGLFTFLLMSGLVIVLAYVVLRYFGNWQMKMARGRRMRVLEGLPLGRDRQLLLVAVDNEILVLGSTPNGVNLVHRLPDGDSEPLLTETAATQSAEKKSFPDFESSIRESLARMRGLMKREPNEDTWRQP